MREVLLLLVIGLAVGIPSAMHAGSFTCRRCYTASSPTILDGGVNGLLLSLVSAAAGLIPAHQQADRSDPGTQA